MALTAKMTAASDEGPGYAAGQIVKGATAKYFIEKGMAEEVMPRPEHLAKAKANAEIAQAAMKAKMKTHAASVE